MVQRAKPPKKRAKKKSIADTVQGMRAAQRIANLNPRAVRKVGYWTADRVNRGERTEEIINEIRSAGVKGNPKKTYKYPKRDKWPPSKNAAVTPIRVPKKKKKKKKATKKAAKRRKRRT